LPHQFKETIAGNALLHAGLLSPMNQSHKTLVDASSTTAERALYIDIERGSSYIDAASNKIFQKSFAKIVQVYCCKHFI
jgi:hypothetical protein